MILARKLFMGAWISCLLQVSVSTFAWAAGDAAEARAADCSREFRVNNRALGRFKAEFASALVHRKSGVVFGSAIFAPQSAGTFDPSDPGGPTDEELSSGVPVALVYRNGRWFGTAFDIGFGGWTVAGRSSSGEILFAINQYVPYNSDVAGYRLVYTADRGKTWRCRHLQAADHLPPSAAEVPHGLVYVPRAGGLHLDASGNLAIVSEPRYGEARNAALKTIASGFPNSIETFNVHDDASTVRTVFGDVKVPVHKNLLHPAQPIVQRQRGPFAAKQLMRWKLR